MIRDEEIMTKDEAIESLIESCTILKEAVEQLQEENEFLTATIEKHNYDEYVSERRTLLEEIDKYKMTADFSEKRVNRIKAEYETKMAEADDRLKDARRKQSNVDLYIEKEVDIRIKEIKAEYENQRAANAESLERHIAECDKQMREKELHLKKQWMKYLVIAAVCVVLGVVSILISVL